MNNKNKENACGSVKVSSRGQIVIPLEIRKKLDIKEGEVLFLVENGNYIKLMKSDIVNKALEDME